MSQVTVYTKSYCPYSARAKHLLSAKGVDFEEIDVTDEGPEFDEMTRRARGHNTTPQVFIEDEYVGGCTDLEALDERGELDRKLH